MRITTKFVREFFNDRVKPIAPLLGLEKYNNKLFVVLKETPDSDTDLKTISGQKSPAEMFNWMQGFLAGREYE